MEIDIPYGQEIIKVTVPDSNVLDVIKPKKVPIADERETIFEALKNPINSVPFSEFISDAKDMLIIVNDATRPTQTAKVLDFLFEQIKDLNLRLIVATGTHRAPTEEELQFIFGSHLNDFRNKIIIHDAKADEWAGRLDVLDAREPAAFDTGDAVISEREMDLKEMEDLMRVYN